MTPWELPKTATLGGLEYEIHWDYRDILEIFSYLQDEALPEFLRWQIALGLFYEEPIPEDYTRQALEFLCRFVNGGREEPARPAPKLLDWEQDAPLIIADINKVSGGEIRDMGDIHWWTFLSWFHGIGQGQLSTVVSLREKLRKGKKPEPWEREFYRENKALVDLKPRYSPAEQAERRRLEELLK